ncbi:TerB family tellurite resistance protein, partial [Fulvivirga aurantia]|uniref:tellurite resistance TerB family protein n=1 Tax=Fulvivirga aurantia TaxID=2529383 RepID=UPI0016287B83
KVDGEVDVAELELIRQIGVSSKVSDADIDEIIDKTEAADIIPSLSKLPREEKINLMSNLVMVMKIDGKIHKEEMRFCFRVLKKLGYPEDALFDLVSTTYIDSRAEVDIDKIRARAEQYLN